MHSIAWSVILSNGCCGLCREKITINDEKYKIVERLTEGGFSLIELAEHTSTRQRCVIKRVVCHSRDDQERALHEVEYARKINSPNVIKLIAHELQGEADIVLNTISKLFIVLPYYKNGSLADYLARRARKRDFMPAGQLLQIFLGICNGLSALHTAKPVPLAHRDLKTANICLSDSLEPIIVDLGSTAEARVQIGGQSDAQRLQDEAEEFSSMAYRAPELFSVKTYSAVDERTDIWSLGCVLYAMCYFQSPFETVQERGDSVALAVISGKVNIPEDSIYTQDIIDLIMLMLRVNALERPSIDIVIERTYYLIRKLEDRI